METEYCTTGTEIDKKIKLIKFQVKLETTIMLFQYVFLDFNCTVVRNTLSRFITIFDWIFLIF